MARRPRALSRNGASGRCHLESSMDEVARPVVDEYPLNDDDLAEAALGDDDDLRDDAAILFGVDVCDDNVQQNNIIDVDAKVSDSGRARLGQGLAPPPLMVPLLMVSVNLVFGMILRRLRKVMLELLLSARCIGLG